MSKIGLLLGSFDPIHIGHLNMASCALNSGLCDKVLFVVAKHNPWKKDEPTPFEVRCELISASLSAFHGQADICAIEKEIEPPTYSYKVIERLKELYSQDELILIGGSDTIERVPQWRNFESCIKNQLGFIEVKRNDGVEIENDKLPFIIHEGSRNELTDKGFWYIKMQRMDASSTMVREMIKNGMNPYPYVTLEALEIINKYNLYR